MICFFCFTQNIKITQQKYEYVFNAIEDKEKIPVDKIYFSTPSNFLSQLDNLKKQNKGDIAFAIDAGSVCSINEFPVDIGFSNLEEKLLPFKDVPEIKIGLLNAVSNSIGDHLIGMQAFNYWHQKVSEFLPNTKIVISFFQLDPNDLCDITRQYAEKINHLYMLPNNLTLLLQQDAYIDFGTLILRDGFDKEHMMDFFLKSFSIDPQSVPIENKRMKYSVSEDVAMEIKKIIQKIRTKNRPLLMFHRSASTQIREIDEIRARKIVAEIIQKSDYFVVSVDGLEYQNERFIDLKDHSESLDCLAAIISEMDAMITVDTCTYHFADAFNIPTVVLFTTIDPELRCKYYPHVAPIMYEEKDGMLFGKHKLVNESDAKKELDHLSKLWDKINVDDILSKLGELNGRS